MVIVPDVESDIHVQYMDGLGLQFEVVVPNSLTSAGHLISHLQARGLPS